jgi:acetoin utilization deacetylase AcuC-like enzyme
VTVVEPGEIDRSILELVHTRSYVDAVERFCMSGGGAIDIDTIAVAESWEAALLAAGAGIDAIDRLRQSDDETAFLAVRPPGHHALANRAMGFCLFNNVAIAAAHLAESGERVAIVDWDVHHGNGTQEIFVNDPDVLYLSAHQYPFYPGGGSVLEVGSGGAEGSVLNMPMPAGTGGDVYRAAFERVVVPVLSDFEPDWILISAGYDAQEADPLAELRLLSGDYNHMATRLAGLIPVNRLITFLEGGYNLAAITSSVAATIAGFDGRPPKDDEFRRSPPASWEALEEVVSVASRFWELG